MYEELQQAIRSATHVEGNVWMRKDTHELITSITRHGETLWKGQYADNYMVQEQALEEIHRIHVTTANKLVDAILDEVNWDEFYPTPEEDPFETLPQMQCPRSLMGQPHERHIEERVQFGTGALVRLVCQGYPDAGASMSFKHRFSSVWTSWR